MSNEYDDPAHDADMEELRREQLRNDISAEEANEECAELDAMLGDDGYDPEQYDDEEDWKE